MLEPVRHFSAEDAGSLESDSSRCRWKVATREKSRRQPGFQSSMRLLEVQIRIEPPPTEVSSKVCGAQRAMHNRLALAGESSAGLMVVIEAELADHSIQIAGQRGKILQGLDGLLGALRALD